MLLLFLWFCFRLGCLCRFGFCLGLYNLVVGGLGLGVVPGYVGVCCIGLWIQSLGG